MENEIRQMRVNVGMTKIEFAKRMGTSVWNVTSFESGGGRLTISGRSKAIKIIQEYIEENSN